MKINLFLHEKKSLRTLLQGFSLEIKLSYPYKPYKANMPYTHLNKQLVYLSTCSLIYLSTYASTTVQSIGKISFSFKYALQHPKWSFPSHPP